MSENVKNEAPAGYVCKGAWILGSACGECSRCLESLPEFLAEDGMPARRARAIIAAHKALHPVAPAGGAEAALAIAHAKLVGQDAEIAHQRNINTLLTDANEQLRQDFRDAWIARDAMREERDKLAAQVKALRKDAERYRWLIDGKRSKYIWNHVLSDEEKDGFNFLSDAIDVNIKPGA